MDSADVAGAHGDHVLEQGRDADKQAYQTMPANIKQPCTANAA